MSDRTRFWLGTVMLALAVGMLIGGLLYPRPTYSQDAGEGRSGNYALIASGLKGLRANSQLVYIIDDRNEALYILEATGIMKEKGTELRDVIDLREFGTNMQKKRAKKETTTHPTKP
jgi:hypothetical protein